MSDEWDKLIERAEFYLAEGFIPRRDVRNVFRSLLTEATVTRDNVVNWRTLIWNIHDEEMGDDPKRIATCMNFINDHYEDCETIEDFEKQLNELLETEEEVLDKLEAVKNAFQIHYSTLHDCAWMDRKKMLKALDETAEEVKKLLADQTSEVKQT